MEPPITSNNFGTSEKILLAPKISLKDKRVNELLRCQPSITCSPRLNGEKMGTRDDGHSFPSTGAVSTSSSPLQDVARFALRAMDEISRMDGSEVASRLIFSSKDGRKTSASRAYEEGPPFQSMNDDSFMGLKDLANGAGFSGNFYANEGMGATNQSLGSERGLSSHSIPVKRKRGRPAKTDLSRLNQSQPHSSKKRRIEEESLKNNVSKNHQVQTGAIDAVEGSSRDQLVNGHSRGASVLKPISENAPKRRGRPPKTHLAAPGAQRLVGDTVPEPTSNGFQSGPDVRAPNTQPSLHGDISSSLCDGFQDTKGLHALQAVGLVGQVGPSAPEKSHLEKRVKKRGPGRPRKTEKILQSVEIDPEHFASHESGAKVALEATTEKSKLDQPRKIESRQQSLKSKATSTTQAEPLANTIDVHQKSHSAHNPATTLRSLTESVIRGEPGHPPLVSISAVPQAEQKTWSNDAIEGVPDHPSKARDLWQPSSQSQSQEKSVIPDITTIVVKKRRGRPPKNKVAVAAI